MDNNVKEQMNMTEIYDVTIIGGGPAGLYAAFYAGLRNMKTKIIEFQSELGGKVRLFPEKKIWDIGGQPPITGDAFIKQLIEQGLTFHPTVHVETKVERIVDQLDGTFHIETNKGTHMSRSVIVAVGGGIIQPQKLQVAGVPKEDVQNMHYVVREFEHFRDQVVLISGGGNTAVDWANELHGIAKEIHVVYRGENLSAHEAQVEQVMKHATVHTQTQITQVHANENTNCIENVTIEQVAGEKMISVDHMIVSHGFDLDQTLQYDVSIPLERIDHAIASTATGKTDMPGIFVAGDIAKYEGKVNLLVGCFQDAVNAVNGAKLHIEPTASHVAMVSSHNERVQKRMPVEARKNEKSLV